jgi:hypothetical protein
MADLTITAANVSLRSDSSGGALVQYGAAVTAPQPIYQKSTDSKWYPGDANVGTEEANSTKIAMTPGGVDEYGYAITGGKLDVGATTVKGVTYILSDSGGWAPESDYASGWYKTILGTATDTAGTIELDIKATGQQKA